MAPYFLPATCQAEVLLGAEGLFTLPSPGLICCSTYPCRCTVSPVCLCIPCVCMEACDTEFGTWLHRYLLLPACRLGRGAHI